MESVLICSTYLLIIMYLLWTLATESKAVTAVDIALQFRQQIRLAEKFPSLSLV